MCTRDDIPTRNSSTEMVDRLGSMLDGTIAEQMCCSRFPGGMVILDLEMARKLLPQPLIPSEPRSRGRRDREVPYDA
jgi:hypothetical protein